MRLYRVVKRQRKIFINITKQIYRPEEKIEKLENVIFYLKKSELKHVLLNEN